MIFSGGEKGFSGGKKWRCGGGILRGFLCILLLALAAACGGGGGAGGGNILSTDAQDNKAPGNREGTPREEAPDDSPFVEGNCKNRELIAPDEICLKTCESGEQIPESEICMQTCEDGGRIPETETCLQTCENGERIPETEICMQTCESGEQIPESEICMQTCEHGGRIPESEICMQTCEDGGQIPESEICMKSCPDGAAELRIPESETCMRNCPVVGLRLFDSECPATKTCADGVDILASDICMQTCKDGGRIPETDICMQTCNSGETIPETETCFYTCSEGKTMPEKDLYSYSEVEWGCWGFVKTCIRFSYYVPKTGSCPPEEAFRKCEEGASYVLEKDYVLQDEVCMKHCRNERGWHDDENPIPEHEECPFAFKQCPNGDDWWAYQFRIPEAETCQKLCKHSSVIAALDEACPALKECPTGDNWEPVKEYVLEETGICQKRCENSYITVGLDEECPAFYACTDYSEDKEYILPSNIDCYGYKNDLKLTSINAADAYLEGALGQGVTVGVADTGMDVSNPRLSASIVPGRDFTDPSRTAEMTDPGGHGTLVGGVIAGDASQNHYGIAPQAKLMPLKIANEDGDFTGSTTEAIEYAVAQGIQVVNHSYGIVGRLRGTYTGEMTVYADAEEDENGEIARRNTIVVTVKNAEFAARVPPHVAGYGAFRFSAGKIRNIIRDKDIIMVWSAGNDGWNAETGRISVCANLTVSFRKCSKDDAGAILRDDFIRGFTKQDGSALSDVEEIYRSYTGAYGMHPIYASDSRATEDKIFDGKTIADFEAIMEEDAGFAEIASRWVVVTALDKKGKIVNFSNGCGPSKFWCISALGVGVETTRAGGGRAAPDGTSFSAPIVSGALAVVKSRFTELPMPVVRAILLSTATPMGARAETGELDDVYGWGKVNLSSAVHFSTGNLSMVVAPGTGEDEDGEDSGGGTDCDITDENSSGCSAAVSADIPLSQARINLPAALAHLKPQMESAQAAVSFNGDAYFNMPLSGIAKIAAAPETELGGAAAELLHPAEDEYFNESVFFAAKDTRTNRFRHAGAAFSSQKFGDWSAQYDFCEDCKKSAWQEWKIFANNENGIENETANTGEEITAPFFAHNEKSFALQMKGEGLRPFASFGEANGMPYEQYGLRLRQNYARFGWLAETSQTNESESFLGANFGAFGKTSSKTTEGKIALHGDLAKNWRGFAEYSRAKSKVQTAGILSAVDGLQAQGWSAGMEWQNIFSGGDRIRFTARQKMSINGGRAILRYSEAEGDFTRAFYGNLPGAESQDAEQELKERTLQLDLSEKANPSIAIGYAAEMQGAEFAIGAEYGNNGKKAISAQFRIDW